MNALNRGAAINFKQQCLQCLYAQTHTQTHRDGKSEIKNVAKQPTVYAEKKLSLKSTKSGFYYTISH